MRGKKEKEGSIYTSHHNNVYWNYYNKSVAVECGVIASSVFTLILKYIKRNERTINEKIAYISSPVVEKRFPEFTLTQIRKGIQSLQTSGYIELKNNTVEVKNDFDYIVNLTAKGETIYSNLFLLSYKWEDDSLK